MSEQLGDRLDALGLTADLDEDDLVAGAIVILKVLRPDGMWVIRADKGLDRWSHMGMLTDALDMMREDNAWITDDEPPSYEPPF